MGGCVCCAHNVAGRDEVGRFLVRIGTPNHPLALANWLLALSRYVSGISSTVQGQPVRQIKGFQTILA